MGDWGLGRAGLRIPNPQSRIPALLQQQHVASAVELGTGRELGDQERAAVVRAQRGHGADREARREAAAESGSDDRVADLDVGRQRDRSEEHTSELQSLMRNSSAVFCLKKKINLT